jgi:decaprenyl-phosphate phosphoribosyltransferase
MINNYIRITRPEHWFKNVTILPGILLAWITFKPQDVSISIGSIIAAFLSTFLIASSNYTINELLDTKEDKKHPDKFYRPVPSGKIISFWGYLQWILLALGGLTIAGFQNTPLFLTELSFFVMGIIYNVKPIRTKDRVYIDVLSESLNNPIRFLIGWYSINSPHLPPVTLILAFWMLGAFFMSVKRVAELRYINNPETAAAYRKPFLYYTQELLISCAVFYAVVFGVFTGIFLINYRVETILAVPLIGGFLGIYMYEGLKKESITRCPERLYQRKFLMGYLFLTLMIILGLLMVHLPWIKSLNP